RPANSCHPLDACDDTSRQLSQTLSAYAALFRSIGGQGDNGTVECPASPSFTSPTTSDSCGTSSIVLDSDSSTAGCGNTYTRTKTWQAVNACNNTSGQVSQTISVVDKQAPSIGDQ